MSEHRRSCSPVGAATPEGGPRGAAYTPRHKALDALSLLSTHERPGGRPKVYRRAFTGVPDALTRPLTGEGTSYGEACPVAALPKAPFLGIGARAFFEKPYLSGV